ncbi:hypothetical protein [Cohnella caldifontis]|uniref:hypothetical protein n=1 Tax=Cohnella caldifontis TaxID=3027471 RepID=UPI0023EC9812|nr:hypothetical protein [Cohnella sp. YIM B05605]
MSKSKRWLVAAAGVVLSGVVGLFALNSSVQADSSQKTPGSSDDPIVTKSYVDQKIAEITRNGGASSASGSGNGSNSMALEIVVVPSDKTIYVKAGGELIVRTGKAIAVSSDTNGLSDLTDGLDIAPGKPVNNNHLLLFPKDGRGVKQDPKTKQELIVLVRGGYELK